MVIAFEGIDGSGKSTQAKMLLDYLKSQGISSTITSPFLTQYGQRVRDLYLQDLNTASLTQVFLLASAVNQLVVESLQNTAQDHVVILDRYIYSTYAYHGEALGVGDGIVKSIFTEAIRGVRHHPELVFLLDVPPEIAQARLIHKRDRIESLPLDFHTKAREGYLKIAKNEGQFIVLDATKDKKQLHEEIFGIFQQKREQYERPSPNTKEADRE